LNRKNGEFFLDYVKRVIAIKIDGWLPCFTLLRFGRPLLEDIDPFAQERCGSGGDASFTVAQPVANDEFALGNGQGAQVGGADDIGFAGGSV